MFADLSKYIATEIVNKHHGWAGTAFLDRISESDSITIKSRYNDISTYLQELHPEYKLDHINYISIITVADILIQNVLFGIDESEARISALENAESIISLIDTAEELEDVNNEWDFLSGWISENWSHLKDSSALDPSAQKDRWGKLDSDYLYIGISQASALYKAIISSGYNVAKFVEELAKGGYITPATTKERGRNKRNTVKQRLSGVPTNCIRIPKTLLYIETEDWDSTNTPS